MKSEDISDNTRERIQAKIAANREEINRLLFTSDIQIMYIRVRMLAAHNSRLIAQLQDK